MLWPSILYDFVTDFYVRILKNLYKNVKNSNILWNWTVGCYTYILFSWNNNLLHATYTTYMENRIAVWKNTGF